MMCFSLFGCGKTKQKQEIEELKALPAGTMVFDYYEKTVGTATETGHDEIVVLISEEGKVELDVYHKPDGENQTEICTKYQASNALLDDLYALVFKYEMSQWEQMKNYPIDGVAKVMKFRSEGKMTRVNAEIITEKYGEKPFSEVYSLLLNAVEKADLMQ